MHRPRDEMRLDFSLSDQVRSPVVGLPNKSNPA